MRGLTPEMVVALSVMVTALAGAWVSIRRRLDAVHTLVNSQLEAVMRRLDVALAERDEAREERDNE